MDIILIYIILIAAIGAMLIIGIDSVEEEEKRQPERRDCIETEETPAAPSAGSVSREISQDIIEEGQLACDRISILHSADNAVELELDLPECLGLAQCYQLASLPIGAQLTVRPVLSDDKRTRMEFVADETVVGTVSFSNGSRLDRIMDSGRISGIYYFGFEGEPDKMRPFAILFYSRRNPHHVALPPLTKLRLHFSSGDKVEAICPN